MLTETKYIETAKKITREIVSQGMRSGDRLDPEYVLLKRYNVSRMTLRRSLDLLEKQKLIRRQRPKGTFVDTLPSVSSFDREFHVPHFLKRRNVTINLEISDCHKSKMIFWEKTIQLYEKSRKGAKVNLLSILRLKDIDKDQANPDVMILPAWSIPHYTKRGMLAKLDSKPDSNLFNGFDESFEYGLPFNNSPKMLYLNCDIAEKLHLPPECFNGTFSSFKKYMLNIAGKESFKLDVSSSFPGYITAGGDFDTPEGRMQLPEKVSEAFEFFAALYRAGIYLEEGSLYRGEALLGTPSGFALNFLKESAPFKNRNIPNILTPESITRYIPACICLSAAAGNKPEVIEFAEFLASPVIQKLIAKCQFSYPAIRDYAPDNSLDQMKPFSTKSFQVPEYMETVFMPISEKVITDAISVSEAIQELKEKTLLYNDNKIGWVDIF